MGTLFAIDTTNTVVLAIVSALSVPVPAQREGESELWIAELGLVGELGRPPAASPPPSTAASRSIRRSATACASPRGRSWSWPSAATSATRCASAASARTRPSPAMVRVDDLLGKHFAILGTTGTGKSCTTGAHPALDPDEEPGRARRADRSAQRVRHRVRRMGRGDRHRNLQLPYWLLDVRGDGRGPDRQPAGAQGRGRDPAGADPDRQGRYGTGRASARARRHCGAAPAPKSPSTRRCPTASPTSCSSSTIAWASSRTSGTCRPTATCAARLEAIAPIRAMPSCSVRSPSTTTWPRSSAACSACPSTASRSPSWS